MIVYRLWNARGRARDSAQSTNFMIRLDSIISIVIDSGLGYTLLSLALFFSQLVRSNALFITSGAVSLLWLIMYPHKEANTEYFEGVPGRRNCIQSY